MRELDERFVALRAALWAMTGGCCWYCGTETDELRRRTIDHVIPRGMMGSSEERWNLVACCGPCNGIKGRRQIEEFRAILGRRVAGWPTFNQAQLEWLKGRLPEPPHFVFYGEQIGLSLLEGKP
jgi:5-methylcytosine-specific restriction endonuclease McrA